MHRTARLAPWLLWAALSHAAACGEKPPAPPAHASAPKQAPTPAPAPAPAPDDEPAPSHDPFEQPDDLPVDRERMLKDLRHDCCTELPPDEVQKHTQPR